MDEKKYVIQISGMQSYEGDSGTNDVELITEGAYFYQDGKYFVEYEESEVTGMAGTKTCIEIDDNYVSLIRNGSVNTQMLFMKDKTTTSYYDTPYGMMVIGVLSNRVESKLDNHGGQVQVEYYMDINNQRTGTNNFMINIREA